jgi:hypothetical protein
MTEHNLQTAFSEASLQWTLLRRRPVGDKDTELFYAATAALEIKRVGTSVNEKASRFSVYGEYL